LPEHLVSGRSFYFIRSRLGKIEYDELDSALDLGVLGEGPSLKGLEQTLSHVFLPMLMQMTGASEGAPAGAGSALEVQAQGGVLGASGMAHKHRDLLSNMQKFLSQVSQALQQLNGDVTLPVSRVTLRPCVPPSRGIS
jgi:dynein heavy chain